MDLEKGIVAVGGAGMRDHHRYILPSHLFLPIVTGELIRKMKNLHQIINIVFVESKFGLAHVVGQVIEIKMFINPVW